MLMCLVPFPACTCCGYWPLFSWWVSDEYDFSPLSDWKWACRYTLAVLTALGKTQSFEIKSWRISISKADHPFLPGATHIYAYTYNVALNHQIPSLVLRLLKFAVQMQMLMYLKPRSALSILCESLLTVEAEMESCGLGERSVHC